jgi:hypothetical protein
MDIGKSSLPYLTEISFNKMCHTIIVMNAFDVVYGVYYLTLILYHGFNTWVEIANKLFQISI